MIALFAGIFARLESCLTCGTSAAKGLGYCLGAGEAWRWGLCSSIMMR